MSTRYPMNNSPAARTRVNSVEWEELPSLPGVMLRRHVPHASYAIASELVQQARERLHSAPVWIETMPAIFDPLLPSAPLSDTHINGLASREIIEPDVFKHFFGSSPVACRG